ncbi:C45 family autoproteolytic acyltransferase/hydolase [Aureibacter tunicatorum]|uniref:Acid ceramidase/N-acylethanolamine-hydrolyzing acid amidase n=1 Tax=Aureibacter tunicatorum TaxID=866807 RepID=A0AAE4BSN9_9BACT|nr:C45 family autoproteolytic acyltransferase/hydolase [Aureibacter tunicatorum]MDR6241419.1 acid ceramidase/N-acylethanolamine-hydrolyzing acid amidase [Aureibacter tunicatorum]BDD06736.1 hypothetical protein AUTU_42190 [Aureibacter tunicatorum]
METGELIVNLDLPASQRWSFLNDYKVELDELLEYYLNDFEDAGFIFENIGDYKSAVISKELLEEIDFISSISRFSPDQVLVANLYYDVLKFYFGCTVFAFHNQETVFHARNLDWHTDNDLLGKYSKVFHFERHGKIVFKTVGWPGFIGALSGMKPGKFSLTLNAVLSHEAPQISTPISFLLRDILEHNNSFDEARERLEQSSLASDSLILLSGVEKNELAVIERTPSRSAVRFGKDDRVVVANDYKVLINNNMSDSILQITSCGRYDRVLELLGHKMPINSQDCLKILKDDKVMMGITVQQMIFNNKTGELVLIKTGM